MSGIQTSINKLIAGVVGAQEAKFALAQREIDTSIKAGEERVKSSWDKTRRVVLGLQNLDVEKMKRATESANKKIQAIDNQKKNYKKRLQNKIEGRKA